ncbi:hypothetical protein JKP88DRAFT_264612 [Tribonema minus]|uniref:Uncharacterized protein n=1 Tax=Tribonema minus TaxID=303371 RepID=A0A835YMX3_9STRA|nr:hypothetical protein JKP88DRAFT_264612 [Tribonema minus]
MGHRIHSLSYDEQTKQVEVKRFMSRYGSNTVPGNCYSYRYSLWQALDGRFQTVKQMFYKYPSPEYSWNYLDELVCGYNSDLIENTKYRRILFAIIPPPVASHEEEEAYIGKMSKLEDYLSAKAEKGQALAFKFRRRFAADGSAVAPEPEEPPTVALEEAKQCVKINVKEGRGRQGKDRYEWLEVLCDRVCEVQKVVHININWMVCSGSSVTEYVLALRRRTQQLGLKTLSLFFVMLSRQSQLAQLPQYGAGPMINVHPFVTHAYIPVSSMAVQRAMDHVLCGPKMDFVRDNDLRTDWKHRNIRAPYTQRQRPQDARLLSPLGARLRCKYTAADNLG